MGAIGPRLTKPVRLEIVGDGLRATLEVASRSGQPHAVSASLTEHGRILDLQSQSDTWSVAELQRRIHFRGRRYRP